MRFLVYFLHADPSIRPLYDSAIAARGLEADIVFVNAGAFSGPYKALAAQLRGADGRVLPSLFRRYVPPRPVDRYDAVVGCSFSAGYAFWRDGVLLSPADAKQLRGLVQIDSLHAAFERDGTPDDGQLAGVVGYAHRATEEPIVYWLGHSDVRTPQRAYKDAAGKLQQPFASTTQVADEVLRLLALERQGVELRAGGLRVRAYDVRQSDTQEHVAALREWGPGFLADALLELADRLEADAGDAPPDTLPDGLVALPQRCLDRALAELARGVREIPGARHNERILEYFSGCVRGGENIGRWLKSDEHAWCAAFLGWCLHRELVAGEQAPHAWRASVRETWADAVARGYAVAADRVRRGEYVPQPGDAWVGTRGGPARSSGPDPFALTAGKGHTGRLTVFGDDRMQTLDGNVGNTVARVDRELGAPEWVGVVRYPRPEAAEPEPPTEAEIEQLARLVELSRDVERGVDGFERLAAALRELPLDG